MRTLEQELIDLIIQANDRWNMFKEGESLIIGVSGGKDSLACLKLLSTFRIKLTAVYIDFFNKSDRKLEVYCSNYADYQYVKSNALSNSLHLKNLCFTCSRQRKRLLLETAKHLGAHKVILGHHKNDVVETLLLNQIYSREISTMSPNQALFKGDYRILRPMYLISEDMLLRYVNQQNIPNIDLRCNHEEDTKRKYIKNLLNSIQSNSPGIDVVDNLFSSMDHIKTDFLP